MGGIICYAKCWACQFDSHFEPVTPHTWMDDEDLDYHADAERLRALSADELAAEHPCACRCAGQPGGCRPL